MKNIIKLLICFLVIIGSLNCAAINKKQVKITESESKAMLSEAEDFIDEINDGRQNRQGDAIYHALRGQNAELLQLRKSRDTKGNIKSTVIENEFFGEGTSRSVKMRLYKPSQDSSQKLPLLVYFHGGGWSIGGLNSCANYCREVASTGNVIVLAVDYSLAPENPYPKGLYDCVSAVEYAVSHASEWGSDASLVSLGGDSSGANLALATSLFIENDKNTNITLRSLILFYPVLKAYRDDSESWKKYSRGYGLDGYLMEAFLAAYIGDGNNKDPMVSPSEASDEQLKRLPPVYIVGASRDILYDQGKEFGNKLKSLGNKGMWNELPGTVHLFITVTGQDTAFKKSVELTDMFLKD